MKGICVREHMCVRVRVEEGIPTEILSLKGEEAVVTINLGVRTSHLTGNPFKTEFCTEIGNNCLWYMIVA